MVLILLISVILIVAGKYFIFSRKKPLPPTPTPKEVTYDHTPSELETIDLINTYRMSIGLMLLKVDSYVSCVCEHHTNYMVNNNLVNHNGFVDRENDLKLVLGVKTVGENVAYNYSTAQAVLKAWLNSPTHKENIEGNYTHFGISIRTNPDGKKYYTNIFVKKLEK